MESEYKDIILGKNHQVKILKSDQLTWDTVKIVLESKKFKDWQDNFDLNGDLDVKSIKIDYVFFFGSMIGFINLIVDCTTKSHHVRLPGKVKIWILSLNSYFYR